VKYACRLLEGTDLPVEHVAERAGFGTPTALRRHFARALETSPAAYRRAFRAAEPRRPPPARVVDGLGPPRAGER
jgi:transcriptional regulator GlxA family with amidase domain